MRLQFLMYAFVGFVIVGSRSEAQQQALKFGQHPGPRFALLPVAGDTAASVFLVTALRKRIAREYPLTNLWVLTEDDIAEGLRRAKMTREQVMQQHDEAQLARALLARIVASGTVSIDSTRWLFRGRLAVPLVEGMVQTMAQIVAADLEELVVSVEKEFLTALRAIHLASDCAIALERGLEEAAEEASTEALAILPNSVPARVCRLKSLQRRGGSRESLLSLATEILAIQIDNPAALKVVNGSR